MPARKIEPRLGDRYEVQREIGHGGMATVYLAHDRKHDRRVALKVLKPELAAAIGAERFLAEIKTTANLQHPHILQLYDSGEIDGFVFYVMPFVDGESLRDRLKRETQLPVKDALRIAQDVTSAVDYAHRQGVIHRDIKPENILLQDGRAVVADFGIALAVSSAGDVARRLTESGMSLGTPQYMSPEQATGERLDGRADIFAIGCGLYEMLVGEPPFNGPTQQAVLARVVTSQPTSIRNTRPTVPVHVERAVFTALQKLPADRFATASAFGDALREVIDSSDTGSHVHTPPSQRTRAPVAFGAVGVVTLMALAGLFGRWSAPSTDAWSSFTQLTDVSGIEMAPTISPDGESFAYAGNAHGTYDIYTQRVGGQNPVLVAGDSLHDELEPAYSPDGNLIAYALGEGGIFVVGATGESPRRITSAGTSPAWSPDGTQLVYSTQYTRSPYQTLGVASLWVVNVNGGEPRQLFSDSVSQALQPRWSPSGARIAFWTVTNGRRDIVTISADGNDVQFVTNDDAVDWAPDWSEDGKYLYFASDRGGTMGIWRIAVDERSGKAKGAPEPVAAGVDVTMAMPRLSRDGESLVFRSMIESVNPARIDFDIRAERVGDVSLLQRRTAVLAPVDISPDGQMLSLHNVPDRQQDVFLMRTDGSALTRLTQDAARDWLPRFTPDGTALTFHSNLRGNYEAWSIRLDGSGRTRLTDFGTHTTHPMVAPDGKRLMVSNRVAGYAWIGDASSILNEANSTRIDIPTFAVGSMGMHRWSPDGRYISGGVVTPSGKYNGHAVYDVQSGTARQLNTDSESAELAWLPDSRRVVYFNSDGALVLQDVVTLERKILAEKLPYPPDAMGSIVAAPNGRALYYGAHQAESNIWLVRRHKN